MQTHTKEHIATIAVVKTLMTLLIGTKVLSRDMAHAYFSAALDWYRANADTSDALPEIEAAMVSILGTIHPLPDALRPTPKPRR